MKKQFFILLISLCSQLLKASCAGHNCASYNEPCYGYGCKASNAKCYGDNCTATNADCYGKNCTSINFSRHAEIPQEIINNRTYA